MERLPAGPDETTQPDEIRRFLGLLAVITVGVSAAYLIAAIILASPRWFAAVLLLWTFAVWVMVFPRRLIRRGNVESVLAQTATAIIAVLVGFGVLLPFLSLILAMAMLIRLRWHSRTWIRGSSAGF